MAIEVQISAYVSNETKARLDRHVRAAGVTRAHVIEQALLHHLNAIDELPADAVVPARIVLAPASADRVRELVAQPPNPTKAMKQLFRDR